MSTAENRRRARAARTSEMRVIHCLAIGVLCAPAWAVLTGCRSPHGDGGPKVIPSQYADQVKRCIVAAEAATGLRCKGLSRAEFYETGRKQRSNSLGRYIAVDEAGRSGYWVPGKAVVYTLGGVAEDRAIEHEVAHQIAYDHGLDREDVDHCPEFRGRIWGWQ